MRLSAPTPRPWRRRAQTSPRLPILSAAAPFKCGGRSGPYFYTDIAVGPLAIKDVADIYPYPNALRMVKVDGATLREWLERSASIFHRIDPTRRDEQPLLGPAFAAYNFDVIDGVDYVIDVTQPARYDDFGALVAPDGRRIRDLMFDGAPIDPNQLFLVVTNNYRASGGGGFPGCDGTNVVIEAPDANRDVVLKYIASQTSNRAKGEWRLAFCALARDSGCDLPDVACCVRTFSPARPEADLDGASARRLREVARRDGVIGARSATIHQLCLRLIARHVPPRW